MRANEKRLPPRRWTSFWFWTALLIVVGLTLFGGAVIAAQGRLIGGDDGAGCTNSPAFVDATSSEGAGVSVTPSYWPLGTDCSLSDSSGQSVTFPETDWTLTVIASMGLAFAVTPVALLPLTWWRARRSAVR